MREDYANFGIGTGGTDAASASTATSSSLEAPIASTNIGFQLLKKHGWKEGTGLGISKQGRLEPIRAYMKKNKRGLGAENNVKKKKHSLERNPSSDETEKEEEEATLGKKAKGITKKTKKRMELEKQMQEKEFEQAFFREFWPDNV